MLKDAGATPEQIASHPHPFYTPIATFGPEYRMMPVAYGLKFAGLLSGARLVKAELTQTLQATGVDATAYAAKRASGETAVIVLNKDASRDLELTLDFGSGKSGSVSLETLHAPALDSREARIDPGKRRALSGGKVTLTVPRASGVQISLA